MLVLKCQDADSDYKRIKSYLSSGQVNDAMKIVNTLDNMNSTTLRDLANECKNELLDLVAEIIDQVQREKVENNTSASKRISGAAAHDDLREL